jgi:hypothetical protein
VESKVDAVKSKVDVEIDELSGYVKLRFDAQKSS